MNNLKSFKNFIFSGIRSILLIITWVLFIHIKAKYLYKNNDEGVAYLFVGGLYATVLVFGWYLIAEYIARKRGWNEKSLWQLWLCTTIFFLIISDILAMVALVITVSTPLVYLLPVYALIITVLLVSIKIKPINNDTKESKN